MTHGDTPDALPVRDVAERFFEPQLQRLDLGVDQINRQTLDELRESLERVNEMIKNVASYETLAIKITKNANVVITAGARDAHYTCTILPFLLERKRLILSRIAELGDAAAMQALDRIEGDDNRSVVAEVRDNLGIAGDAAREESSFQHEVVHQQHLVEVARARAEIWHSFLARESVATIVGGILLFVLGTTMIVAMFVGVPVTDILANAFLVILGYFFGQSAATRNRNASGVRPSEA
jgi:hypothetical protein